MTIATQLGNVLWTFIGVAALWVVCRFFVAPALVDHLRYRLFKIRREMFLYMAAGGIDPSHLAYGRVRVFMNAAIRYADGLSLTRGIVNTFAIGDSGSARTQKLAASIETLPIETRKKIEGFRRQASSTIAIHMLLRSPLGWFLMLISVPMAVIVISGFLVRAAWARAFSREALDVFRQRAEEETQMLRCMEDESIGIRAAA